MPPKFARVPGDVDIRGSSDRERRGLLDGNSDDDDFFLKGPSVKTDRLRGGDPKLSKLQTDVDEVVDIMKDNVARVVDRGERLQDLQDKSEDLSNNSSLFRTRSKALHKRMWWQNCRMRLVLIIVILIIVAIIVAALAIHFSEDSGT